MVNIGLKKSGSFINAGFTIIELLVVIIIISILVLITVVSYGAITEKAVIENLKADLGGASTHLMRFYADNGDYPSSITDCPNTNLEMICAKVSDGNTYDYTSDGQTYELCATNTSLKVYCIDNVSSIATVGPNWLTIGTQTWATKNLNVGTMINGGTAQTNNSIVEKWCYNNLESNCVTYGALYQWGETVQYQNGASNTTSPSPVFSGNVQGICPTGSHIPNLDEWTTLTTYLGASTAGTQLKTGGSSGLNIPLSGYYSVFFGELNSTVTFMYWSSVYHDNQNYAARLTSGGSTVTLNNFPFKYNGYSVRCLKN